MNIFETTCPSTSDVWMLCKGQLCVLANRFLMWTRKGFCKWCLRRLNLEYFTAFSTIRSYYIENGNQSHEKNKNQLHCNFFLAFTSIWWSFQTFDWLLYLNPSIYPHYEAWKLNFEAMRNEVFLLRKWLNLLVKKSRKIL